MIRMYPRCALRIFVVKKLYFLPTKKEKGRKNQGRPPKFNFKMKCMFNSLGMANYESHSVASVYTAFCSKYLTTFWKHIIFSKILLLRV